MWHFPIHGWDTDPGDLDIVLVKVHMINADRPRATVPIPTVNNCS